MSRARNHAAASDAGNYQPALRRSESKGSAKPSRIVAFDFETTRIEPGTPQPLYLTAFNGGDGTERVRKFELQLSIKSLHALRLILRRYFLTRDEVGTKFVAWNANNFDTYFIAAALVADRSFVLRPYMTNSGSLRGLRVVHAKDIHNRNARSWEFLDGIAMLGMVGVSLEKFLANFAPEYRKLTGTIDFERETFDPKNKAHRDYAFRDSVGLWHGMERAQQIMLRQFNQPLRATMGAACIRIFKANIPESKVIRPLPDPLRHVVRSHVLRGGFCYCVRRYSGPVWKYDLNQAYAAAMREAKLPAGAAWYTADGLHSRSRIYVARITAENPRNTVPFYYRTEVDGRMRSVFADTRIADTWLTSIEVEQLRSEGWRIECSESWWFDDSFSMREFVDSLERVRMSCEGGPAGPTGAMIKMAGNHSYGKTLEQIDTAEYVIAAKAPPGFVPFYPDEASDPLPFVHYRMLEPDELQRRDYHQPHVGAFITAHVRMVVRRAALLDSSAWLYADTDCVVFDRDMTDRLHTHPSKYGAWKVEEQGTDFRIIAKKVYFNVATGKGHAKGLNVKRLAPSDFETWFDGMPPIQEQVQRNSFLKVLQGAEMYRSQTRRGTSVEGRHALASDRNSSRATNRD